MCSCCRFRNWRIPAKCATRICCLRSSICRARRTFPQGSTRAAVGRGPRLCGGPAGAEARRGKRRPPGLVAPRAGFRIRAWTAPVAAAAVPRAGGRGEDLAGGGEPPVSGASARGMGCEDAGRAVHGAAGAGDGAGVVRRGGARADAGGRRSRRGTRTSRCWKSRRRRSTPGSSGTPTGASASRWAT